MNTTVLQSCLTTSGAMTINIIHITAMVESDVPISINRAEKVWDIHTSSGTIFTCIHAGKKLYSAWMDYTMENSIMIKQLTWDNKQNLEDE
tara:strand:- start:407 stop:679 length:273 start_codon:yes stop_codon:yes gene_type:complete